MGLVCKYPLSPPTLPALLCWDFALPELVAVMGQSGLATDFLTYIKSDLPILILTLFPAF